MQNTLVVVILLAAAVPALAQGTRHRAMFAVVPGGSPPGNWLARGAAFDLEKRLGRLPALDAADRLDVAGALRSAADTEDSRARAVLKSMASERPSILRQAQDSGRSEFVLYAIASAKGDQLSLRVDLWTAKGRAASLVSDGAREDLFELIDALVDRLLLELAKTGIRVGRSDSIPGLKWRPCRSVAAFETLIAGIDLLSKGDTAQAKALLLKVLSAEPDNWYARYYLGAAALRRGDIPKAAEYCREAIALNPDVYPGVYANLSYCCAAMGEEKQAELAKLEFERRTGKPLPARVVPGGMPAELFGARP